MNSLYFLYYVIQCMPRFLTIVSYSIAKSGCSMINKGNALTGINIIFIYCRYVATRCFVLMAIFKPTLVRVCNADLHPFKRPRLNDF